MGGEDVAWGLCPYLQMSTHGSQEMKVDHLELESQVVVNHSVWLLGTGPGTSGRMGSAFSIWAISTDSSHGVLIEVYSL